MGTGLARAYVGTSAWAKPQWRGGFYPAGLARRRELEYLSRRLTSLEINSTFHGLQRPTSFDSWRGQTPDGFVFAVKGYNRITRAHLRNARAPLADFFASGITRLDAKLGPLLWQLPAELDLQLDDVERFITMLPRSFDAAADLATESRAVQWVDPRLPDRTIRHAIEVRNQSFVNPDFIELMRVHDVAIAFTNAPAHPRFRELTSDFAYVRLSSGPGHFSAGYDDDALDQWAVQLEALLSGEPSRDVFVYFNNPNGDLPHTPFNALRLIERLRGGSSDEVDEGRLF